MGILLDIILSLISGVSNQMKRVNNSRLFIFRSKSRYYRQELSSSNNIFSMIWILIKIQYCSKATNFFFLLPAISISISLSKKRKRCGKIINKSQVLIVCWKRLNKLLQIQKNISIINKAGFRTRPLRLLASGPHQPC